MTPRRCRPEDVPRVAAAATAIFRPPGSADFGRDFPLLFSADNAHRLWICEDGGQIVAHVGTCALGAVVLGHDVAAALFGAVFTVPEYRGRGLAGAVLEAAVRGAREEGAEVGIISGARGLYERAGFERLAATEYVLASTSTSTSESGWGVERAGGGDVASLAALHEGEEIRFVRDGDQWGRLLSAGTVFYGPGAVMVVRRGGRAVAYAAFEGRATTFADGTTALRAVELAGDRAALVEAVPRLAGALSAGVPLALIAAPHDRALAEQAVLRGWGRVAARRSWSAAAWSPAMTRLPVPSYGLNYV